MVNSSSHISVLGFDLLRNPFVREEFGTVDLFWKMSHQRDTRWLCEDRMGAFQRKVVIFDRPIRFPVKKEDLKLIAEAT